jgi:hypothetical protein
MSDFDVAFEIKSWFDEMLDESYPVFQIGDLTFYPSQILRECDPIAYRQSLLDFEDTILENEKEEHFLELLGR